ncbi:MAG: HAD family phosphatase [Opitutales bacterium]|nr:HAD family phosphatase [Opitutales bacterium]
MDIQFPTKEYKGYIFDCDGTLADSMSMHYVAWRRALAQSGAKFDFSPECFQSVAGIGHEETVEIFNEKFGEQLDPISVSELKHHIYEELVDSIQPIPAVVAFAEAMINAGRLTSVASGGDREMVHRTLKAIGMDGRFPYVVTQNDVRRGKPDPEIFLLAAKQMGVAPEDCVVFEDSPNGLKAAELAGMDSVVIPETIIEL